MNIETKTKRNPWIASGSVYFATVVSYQALLYTVAKRDHKKKDHYEGAKHKDNVMESIYYRLRYVEADHIVFDPVSGMEAPATHENIMTMLRTLSASMNEDKR